MADVENLLASLAGQTYASLEVVFVGERDRSILGLVEERASRLGMTNVTTGFNPGKWGLSSARNEAVTMAKGSILAFLDDDVVPDRHWANEVVEAFQDSNVIGVTGPALPRWSSDDMSWFPEYLDWLISCTRWNHWESPCEVRNAWGMNMAFRREAFDIAGLFDNRTGYHKGLFAEDNEFSFRVRRLTRRRIMYAPTATVWHSVHRYRLSWRFLGERARWIGSSRRHLAKYFGGEQLGAGGIVATEMELSKNILFRRIPREVLLLARDPAIALRRLAVTSWAAVWVAIGYLEAVINRKEEQDTEVL